jgi:hypothetical protein
MDNMEVLKYLAPLGVGGVLAWGMFVVYRKDIKSERDTLMNVVISNTAAITELTTLLKRQNGSH